MRKIIVLILVAAVFGLTLFFAADTPSFSADTMDRILDNYLTTGAENSVTAVYLDYRVLDTVLEVFLLLVSVTGISQFLRLELIEQVHSDHHSQRIEISEIVSYMGKALIILAALFGVYIILFGANSPGGGFQGGAVLATIAMILHLTRKNYKYSLPRFSAIEEILFMAFLAIVLVYFHFYEQLGSFRWLYLALGGIIIGCKVAIGLSTIFVHFVGRDEHRTTGGDYE